MSKKKPHRGRCRTSWSTFLACDAPANYLFALNSQNAVGYIKLESNRKRYGCVCVSVNSALASFPCYIHNIKLLQSTALGVYSSRRFGSEQTMIGPGSQPTQYYKYYTLNTVLRMTKAPYHDACQSVRTTPTALHVQLHEEWFGQKTLRVLHIHFWHQWTCYTCYTRCKALVHLSTVSDQLALRFPSALQSFSASLGSLSWLWGPKSLAFWFCPITLISPVFSRQSCCSVQNAAHYLSITNQHGRASPCWWTYCGGAFSS